MHKSKPAFRVGFTAWRLQVPTAVHGNALSPACSAVPIALHREGKLRLPQLEYKTVIEKKESKYQSQKGKTG